MEDTAGRNRVGSSGTEMSLERVTKLQDRRLVEQTAVRKAQAGKLTHQRNRESLAYDRKPKHLP